MGKNTFYCKCTENSEYDSGDFEHVQIDLPPKEVARIFKARDVRAETLSAHPDIGLQSLTLSSTAAFGNLDMQVIFPTSDADTDADEDSADVKAEELNEEMEDDFIRERRGWSGAFNQHSTDGNRILIDEYGIEWRGFCKYSSVLVYTEVGWGFFESFVLREGLINLNTNTDVQGVAAGIVAKRDVSGLPILADALDEAGNPFWIGKRLREVMKDFGSDKNRGEPAYDIVDGLTLKRLAGPLPKPKKVPRGKRKAKR